MSKFTERICKNCGGKFSVLISYLKYRKKIGEKTPGMFCSRECFFIYRKNTAFGISECKICGKKFKFKKSAYSGNYCSRRCAELSHKRPESWEIKNCVKCGNQFKAKVYFNQKYCSRKCSGLIKSRISKKCELCGNQYEITKSRKKIARFCSIKCLNNWLSSDKRTREKMAQTLRRRFENKENHPNWQGGISFEPYSPEFNNKLKTQIRKRDGNQCQFCGTKQNGRKFPVHHIDYDKKNNNSFNLISLCDFHHLLTNGNRNKWQFFFESYQEIRLLRAN